MRRIALLALLLAPLWGHAAAPATPGMDAALAQAKLRHAPVLLDFHAPWCHSCYYMQKHVLTGAEWQAFTQKTVVLALDTDTPEGAYWKAQYQLVGVPTYVLINATGQEQGRLLGDMPRAQFYQKLGDIQGQTDGLSPLKTQALTGKAEAAVAVLLAYNAAVDGAGGLGWWQSLPETVRTPLAATPAISRELARLALAQGSGSPAICLPAAGPLLGTPFNCESAADLSALNSCLAPLPSAERRSALAPYRAPLNQLLASQVLTGQCSDNRDPVLLAAELATLDDDAPGAKTVLNLAIAGSQKQLAKGVRSDKSVADNLRVFLDQAGRNTELDALLNQLIKAYPTDYNYPNRKARLLAQRGQHAAALPLFARAAKRAYGINKLRNAQEWVKSLHALGRTLEAQLVAEQALADNGPWFEGEAAKLKALIPPPVS